MKKNLHIRRSRTLKFVVLATAFALVGITESVRAAELQLPNASEVQYFSPEAQQFYAAGVAALDIIDYRNAYSMFAKAAALQPTAIQLNRITATLAIYQGRQHQADEARDYYATAVNSLNNILRVPTISGDLRRQITNELKIAQNERDSLAQRDVLREAAGTTFFMEYNRKYAKRPERPAGTLPEATPATTLTQRMLSPLQQMMMPGQQQYQGMQGQYGMPGGAMPGMPGGAMPGMPGGMPGGAMPGMPGALPGMPGAMPGGMPGQPGMMPQQGMPGNTAPLI